MSVSIGTPAWWRSAFTIAESDMIEAWRQKLTDKEIIGLCIRGKHRGSFPNRRWQEIRDYLLRNERRQQDTAA